MSRAASLTLEIRVLWGGALLRVQHHTPPRPLCLGDLRCATDLDPRLPLVAVERGAVSVLLPPGARAALRPPDAPELRALDPALGRIPLSLGAGVVFSLPAAARGSAYRALPEEVEAPGLAVEISVAPAEPAVGRPSLLRSTAHLLGLGAAVAAGMTASVGCAALNAALNTCPCDHLDEEAIQPHQIHALAALYAAAAEKIPEAPPEPRPVRPPYTPQGWLAQPEWWDLPGILDDPRPDPWLDIQDRPFEDPVEAAFLPAETLCARQPWHSLRAAFASAEVLAEARAHDFGTKGDVVCDSPLLTGLRRADFPLAEHLSDGGPSPLWRVQFSEALRHRVPPWTPRGFDPRYRSRASFRLTVTTAAALEPAERSPAELQRALNTRHAALRACYELGLYEDARLAGELHLDLHVGVDGVVSARRHFGKIPNEFGTGGFVGRCMAGALDGVRSSPPRLPLRGWARVSFGQVRDR